MRAQISRSATTYRVNMFFPTATDRSYGTHAETLMNVKVKPKEMGTHFFGHIVRLHPTNHSACRDGERGTLEKSEFSVQGQ